MADWVNYTRVDGAGDGGGQGSSTVPESPLPTVYQVVDNCCHVDRQCNTEQEWSAGYHAFLNNHCSAAFRAQVLNRHPGISIEGPSAFISLIEQALDLLKSRAPYWYRYSIGGLRTIRMLQEGALGHIHPFQDIWA